MIQVSSIGPVTLSTPRLERQVAHYVEVLGLSVIAREPGAAFLACRNDRHSIVLRQGEAAGCALMTLRLPQAADLRDAVRQLAELGIAAQLSHDPEPEVAERVSFLSPDGQPMALIRERLAAGDTERPTAGDAEHPAPEGAVAASPAAPLKLGHVAFRVGDPERSVGFFRQLGFRVSDWIGDFFVFLRCGPDHHSLNFMRSREPRLHHLAIELRDWAQVKESSDQLGRHRIPLIWGPGRHQVGHNIYTYHHDPDGHVVELFTELDRMSDEASGCWDPRPWHATTPLRPGRWAPDDPFLANAWGIPTPPGMRDA